MAAKRPPSGSGRAAAAALAASSSSSVASNPSAPRSSPTSISSVPPAKHSSIPSVAPPAKASATPPSSTSVASPPVGGTSSERKRLPPTGAAAVGTNGVVGEKAFMTEVKRTSVTAAAAKSRAKASSSTAAVPVDRDEETKEASSDDDDDYESPPVMVIDEKLIENRIQETAAKAQAAIEAAVELAARDPIWRRSTIAIDSLRSTSRPSTTASQDSKRSNSAAAPTVEDNDSGERSQFGSEMFCVSFSPDSKMMAIGCGDGTVRTVNVGSGKMESIFTASANTATTEALPVMSVRWRPLRTGQTRGILLSAGADGCVTQWHQGQQQPTFSVKEDDNHIYALDYSQDGDRFVTGGRDGKIRIYDEVTKKLTNTFERGGRSLGHSSRVYAVRYRPTDPNVILSGGWDNTVHIWDTRVGSSVRSFFGPHICGDALDMNPTGSIILTASHRPETPLEMWDFATGNRQAVVPWLAAAGVSGRTELLYTAQFNPTGEYIAAGGCGGGNEARVFTARDGQLVDRVAMGSGGCYSVAWSQDGRQLAIGGGIPGITVLHPPLAPLVGPIPSSGSTALSSSSSAGTSSTKGASVRKAGTSTGSTTKTTTRAKK